MPPALRGFRNESRPALDSLRVRVSALATRVLLGLLLAVPANAWALEPGKALTQFPSSTWQTEDGLPQNSILSLVQTADGYLWGGTYEGLVRFDGVRFTVFDPENTPALPDRFIWGLARGQDGTLWIGTGSGLAGMREGTFFRVTPPQGITLSNLRRLLPARDGSLWITTAGHGLLRLSQGHFQVWKAGDGLGSDHVDALAEDAAGNLWVASQGGLLRWDGSAFQKGPAFADTPSRVLSLALDRDGGLWAGTLNGLVYRLREGRMHPVPEASLPGTPIGVLLVDRPGTLWVGSTDRGLLRLAHGQRSVLETPSGLEGDAILALLEDAEGNLWVGTESRGLHRLEDGLFSPYGRPEGVVHDMMAALHESRDGGLWFATQGGGVTRLKQGEMTHWTTREGLPSNRVLSIAEARDGGLWLGTQRGVSRWRAGRLTRSLGEAEGLHGGVRTVHEDEQGTLWAGTHLGLARWSGKRFELLSPRDGWPGASITVLHPRAAGGFWVGSGNGGLGFVREGRFVPLASAETPLTGSILTLHEEAEGTLWIGSTAGLTRWKAGRFTRFTRAEGLFDDAIFQALPDGRGNLWLGCNKGVFRVSQEELDAVAEGRLARVRSRLHGTDDGMRSPECNAVGWPSGLRSRDGRLWFPTIRGAVVYDPNHELAPAAPPPPVLLEEVRVDGRTVPASQWGQLPPGTERVEIHYTSPRLGSPRRLRFRYQLEGLDKDWVEAGPEQRKAGYTHLPPGHYRFRVMALSAEDGQTTPIAELSIHQQPRFHETRLFRAACVLAGALVIAGGMWLRLREHRQRQRQLQARVEERTTELRARLQELQDTRERLVQAEKLAAVGTLASGVGHEINNPLAFIISNLNYVTGELRDLTKREEESERWQEVEQALSEAKVGAERVRRIVADLRTLARAQREPSKEVDLHTLLDVTLATADGQLRPRARVVKEYGTPPTVLGDELRLGQVFLHLLVNAAQAIPEGRADQNEVQVTTRRDERGHAVIEVSDTGVGIPPEVLPHIFEPFFTTRPVGEGTGLGLSICHTHLQAMGGDIQVRSAPGRGTTFTVTLPPCAWPNRLTGSNRS
ncbi:C4-dicarboxylate-specific signal transduction histidine kinase [Archangium gephyra]|uniref:histidine kinase n=1 Tax=Archangium gephyra TaxID=48 RepID=A0ABX9JU85_9BACT|nr:C4-dicarboxylate-specific signal transduction histidine kinase [Archangium gephyra]